jgi:hypothetical protein
LIILSCCRWENFHLDDHLKLRITCGIPWNHLLDLSILTNS